MNATSLLPKVGVDLSKHVFELAVADGQWRMVERARLTRSQFERWFANRAVGLVVMEACGSAQHWGPLANHARHRSAAATGALCARLRQAQQDRRS